MLRRINYTGRKRIGREDIRIILYEAGVAPAKFDAQLQLAKYALPSDATVFIEAYRQTFLMRFDFGTVSNLKAPADRNLSEFESPEGILFRVKVTSQSPEKGKLLAEADRIPFHRADEEQEDRIPILPVVPQDLGPEITKIDFADEPRLLVNSVLPGYRNLALSPAFMSLVYPAALREILTRILRIERHRDTEDAEDWRSKWLLYSMFLPGIGEPPQEEEEDTVVDDWIDEVITAFTRKFGMLQKFESYWREEQPE
jgi:hypothetical protein